MSIEAYNRLKNVQHITVQHNYSITGHVNTDLIDRLLNIRGFTGHPTEKDLSYAAFVRKIREGIINEDYKVK